MSSAHIEIPSTNRHNQAVRSAVSSLTEAIATLKKLKPVLDQTALGNDYAALAVLLDLSGASAEADAELTINYITNVIVELEADTDVQAFLSRFG